MELVDTRVWSPKCPKDPEEVIRHELQQCAEKLRYIWFSSSDLPQEQRLVNLRRWAQAIHEEIPDPWD